MLGCDVCRIAQTEGDSAVHIRQPLLHGFLQFIAQEMRLQHFRPKPRVLIVDVIAS